MKIRLLHTLSIGVISILPIAAQASPAVDYDAIAAKVDLAVSVMLHKQNNPLDDDDADAIRVMSFATQVLKPDLSKIDPNLLFVCSVEEIYKNAAQDRMIDSRINVNPAIVFSHGRRLYLDNRFPEKAGLSLKKLMKIERKRGNYRRRLMSNNTYMPHKDTPSGAKLLPRTHQSETEMRVSSLCATELSLAVAKHQPAITEYVSKTLNSTVVATTE